MFHSYVTLMGSPNDMHFLTVWMDPADEGFKCGACGVCKVALE